VAYLIAQLSDCHVVEPGRLLNGAVDTTAHLAEAVRVTAALKPDLVLVTGDLVDGGRPEQYDHLRSLLAPLADRLVLVPGNHDDRANLVAAFPAIAPDHGRDRLDGVREGPVRLVWLDTLRAGEPGGRLDGEQLQWLDRTLAERPDHPTVLALHHPPFVTGIHHMDLMGLHGPDATALASVVGRHPQVERVVCGHLHRSITRRWAGTTAMTVPSTCHAVALDLDPDGPAAWTREPPMVTVHRWSAGDGLVTHLRPVGPYAATPFG
jgi:3',5'-cyclic AMP phosphodiesterase CpdA